jgi:SAM-dependent methyltransferase
LDVGANDGFFLHLARQSGWDVQGVEIAESAAAYAREVFDLDVFVGQLTEANFPDQAFDVVTFWHVLEHVHDPLGHLQETYRILKPGGLLIVEVPNISSWQARLFGARWRALDTPRHLYHFSPDSLKAMLQKAGFMCFRVGYWARGHNMGGWNEPSMDLTSRLIPKSARELQSPQAFGLGLRRYLRYSLFLPLNWGAFALEQVAVMVGQGGNLSAFARRPGNTAASGTQ